mgnify:CR=1 FL=1
MNINQQKSKRGGARPNAGRPIGSKTKCGYSDLLRDIESKLGQSFTEVVADNYLQARVRQDWSLVATYDRAILNKLAPDLHHIEFNDITDVEAKQAAFRQALQDLEQRSVPGKIKITK